MQRCRQAPAVVLRTGAEVAAKAPAWRELFILAGGHHNGLADIRSGPPPSCRAAGPAAGAKSQGKSRMRLILGIIIGGALTIGGAYVADKTAASGPQPMVNWDVVSKNVDSLTSLARDGWKKITG
jgi:hypothetical protein